MKLAKLQFDSMWARMVVAGITYFVISGIASLKGTPLTDMEHRHLAMMFAAFLILDLLADILKALSSILEELKK